MAIQSQPSRIPEPFAGSGTKNTIPATNATPSASQAASWASGFPPECSQPISAGGCPVPRNDVNGALNQITQDYAFRQDGGIWEWSALADYDTHRMVRGSDGLLYWSVAQSGPSIAAGPQDPTADSGTYWTAIPSDNADVVHKTGAEVIYGEKTFMDDLLCFGGSDGAVTVGLQSSTINVGELPAANEYFRFLAADKSDTTNGHRFAVFGATVFPSGMTSSYVIAESSTIPQVVAQIEVVAPADGSDIYATAPSTSSSRTNGGDIVTRDWIPKDTRIVHTDDAVINSSLRSPDNTGSLSLLGGQAGAYTNGGKINVYGASYSDTTLSGGIVIQTGGSTSSQHKYLNIYKNGTLTWDGNPIQTTSDERLKTPLAAVPDDVLDAWEAVGWGQFKFLEAVAEKGEAARLHLGLIAQRVKAVFEERGLDACRYGILCREERPAADGEPAVDLWMVRYEEALCMEVCCQRRRADRAEARLAALEERLCRLEAVLASQGSPDAEEPVGEMQDAENQ